MARKSNSRGLVLLLITSCFFISGLLFDYMPMIIDDYIKRTIELATNEEVISFWSRPPVEVNSYYWLYDIANAERFQNEGAKPQVRQLGPFHFISRMEKRIVGLSANKLRVTYNSTRFIHLNESCSSHLLDQPVTLLNPIYVSVLEASRAHVRDFDAQTRAIAYGSINKLTERFNESILQRNTTARKALLGVPMPIVAQLLKLAATFGMDSSLGEFGASASNASLGPPKYGYMTLLNDTFTGPFEIYTGFRETSHSLGEIISYKGKRRLSYFDGKCNRLQASAGELRPMPVEADKRLEMFRPEFCRIVHLEPTGTLKLREGAAISYVLSPDDFASAYTNPDNRCFCVNSSGPTSFALANNPLDDNHCSLDGVIELGPCSHGAPLLVSPSNVQLDTRILNSLSPDFDPELLRGELSEVELNDDRAQIVILKRVGLPVRADITVTIFARVLRDRSFRETANVPEVSYVPLLTSRETVTIPRKMAQIIINLESIISLTYHLKVVMYLSAVVLLCWLSGHYYCKSTVEDDDTDGSGSDTGGGASQNVPADGRRPTDRGSKPTLSRSVSSGAAVATTPASETVNSNGAGDAALREPAADKSALGGEREEPDAKMQAAATVDLEAATNSSERANSADSNKSLPPSRHMSGLSSLSQASDAESGGAGSRDQFNSPPPAPLLKGPSTAYAANDAVGGGHQSAAGRKQTPPTLTVSGNNSTRIFSKVDEELAGRGRNRVGAATPNSAIGVPSAAADRGGHLSSGGLASGATGAGQVSDEERKGGNAQGKLSPLDCAALESGASGVGETLARADMATTAKTSADAAEKHQQRVSECRTRRRKGWFMNVYSNFVHMLNELRNTIKDAGQLEVNENDYHDRQLEMLAGRIDNWYIGARSDQGSSVASQHNQQQPDEMADAVAAVARTSLKAATPGLAVVMQQSASAKNDVRLGMSDAAGAAVSQIVEPSIEEGVAAGQNPPKAKQAADTDLANHPPPPVDEPIKGACETTGDKNERPPVDKSEPVAEQVEVKESGTRPTIARLKSQDEKQKGRGSANLNATRTNFSTGEAFPGGGRIQEPDGQLGKTNSMANSFAPPGNEAQVGGSSLASAATAAGPEAGPTERNELNLRSMGVNLSAQSAAEKPAVAASPGDGASESNQVASQRTSPRHNLSGRGELAHHEGASIARSSAANKSDTTAEEEVAEDGGEDELIGGEAEPERERAVADELDKAATLSRVADALNVGPEEPDECGVDGGFRRGESAEVALEPRRLESGGLDRLAAAGQQPEQTARASPRNSSGVNQSTAGFSGSAGQVLDFNGRAIDESEPAAAAATGAGAAKATNEQSSGLASFELQPPLPPSPPPPPPMSSNKLLESNGLANGLANERATSGSSSPGGLLGPQLTIPRDGDEEESVDDDETKQQKHNHHQQEQQQQQQQQQRDDDSSRIRTKIPSKPLVPNSLLSSFPTAFQSGTDERTDGQAADSLAEEDAVELSSSNGIKKGTPHADSDQKVQADASIAAANDDHDDRVHNEITQPSGQREVSKDGRGPATIRAPLISGTEAHRQRLNASSAVPAFGNSRRALSQTRASDSGLDRLADRQAQLQQQPALANLSGLTAKKSSHGQLAASIGSSGPPNRQLVQQSPRLSPANLIHNATGKLALSSESCDNKLISDEFITFNKHRLRPLASANGRQQNGLRGSWDEGDGNLLNNKGQISSARQLRHQTSSANKQQNSNSTISNGVRHLALNASAVANHTQTRAGSNQNHNHSRNHAHQNHHGDGQRRTVQPAGA